MSTPVRPRQLTPSQMADLAGLTDVLVRDERTRPYMAQLITALFPERAAAFKDIQADQKIAALEKRLAEREYQRAVKDNERAQNRHRQRLIDEGYTKDQVDAIKGVIDKYKIDGTPGEQWEAARVLYQHEHKTDEAPADRPDPKTPTWEFPTVEGRDGKFIPFAEFIKDPATAARNAAYRVIESFKTTKAIPRIMQ